MEQDKPLMKSAEEVTEAEFIYSNTNPFTVYQPESGQLRIDFELIDPAAVSLSVYDLNGRELQSLIRNQTFSSGTHTVIRDLSVRDYPSVCLVKYTVNGNLNIKKIQLK